jgi:hypothetical protein
VRRACDVPGVRIFGHYSAMVISVGERFARAVAAQDAPALLALLAPDVDFRGMTPGRFWEAGSAVEVVDDVILGQWFAPANRIDAIVAIEHDVVVDRERVGYRFHVTNDGGAFVVEQQAYYGVEGDRVTWLRIMCSGYRQVDGG